MTLKKEMLYSLFTSTQATTTVSPPPLQQIILCESYPFLQVPQKKILILNRILIFHKTPFSDILPVCIISLYIDLTVNTWCLPKFHSHLSPASTKFTFTTMETKSVHNLALSPHKCSSERDFQWLGTQHICHSLVLLPHNPIQYKSSFAASQSYTIYIGN